MNNKAKGNRNEHKSMALLEAQGYLCTRGAASLGTFDIIAIGAKGVLLVQVKSNRWPRAKEMEAIRDFACPSNCVKVVHRWRDYAKEPDVKEVY